jgi:uncharacterized peroxidase-related enzyme
MSFLLSSPGTTDLPDVFKKYPRRSVLMLRLMEDILRTESPFTQAERELIFAYTSLQNACNFCYDSHRPVAITFGIDEQLFEELNDDIESSTIDDKLKPVFQYVKKLNLTPSRMTQADTDAIYQVGWDEQALVDVVSICGIANLFNRLVDGVGIDVSSEQAANTGLSLLTTIGYGGIATELEKMIDN